MRILRARPSPMPNLAASWPAELRRGKHAASVGSNDLSAAAQDLHELKDRKTRAPERRKDFQWFESEPLVEPPGRGVFDTWMGVSKGLHLKQTYTLFKQPILGSAYEDSANAFPAMCRCHRNAMQFPRCGEVTLQADKTDDLALVDRRKGWKSSRGVGIFDEGFFYAKPCGEASKHSLAFCHRIQSWTGYIHLSHFDIGRDFRHFHP